MRIRLVAWLLLVCPLLRPTAAPAWGPAVHIREADRAIELLVAENPEWQPLIDETPLGRSYLRVGSIAPDFQWLVSSLPFGHSKGLSYHLIENAPSDRPEFKLFAFGHLAHNVGDANAEAFFGPTVWSTNRLGVFDLFTESTEDGRGETETISEGFGDVVLADWGPVIDLLYDFVLEGDDSLRRQRELARWYCETGREYERRPVDCDRVVLELGQALGGATSVLGSLDREGGKGFLRLLFDKPLPELARSYVNGTFTDLLGVSSPASPRQRTEFQRLLASPIVSPAFRELYDEFFADLGPTWAVGHLTSRNDGWPGYDGNAIRSANHQSVLQFLPRRYASGRGLTVDDVTYRSEDGAVLGSVGDDRLGRPLVARVQFYGTMPLQGTVRGVVRKDRAGFSPAEDEVLGSAEIEIDIVPPDYSDVPRLQFEIPFVADGEGALGYYFELYLNDDERPWYTSSWDELWSVEELPLVWNVYRNHFGTYGHFPRSLRRTNPDTDLGSLFVAGRFAPYDAPVPGLTVELPGLGLTSATASSGLARFDLLPAGPQEVEVRLADGSLLQSSVVEIVAGGETWLDATAALPASVRAPAFVGQRCLAFEWDFLSVPSGVSASANAFLIDAATGESLSPSPARIGNSGRGEVCRDVADGRDVAVRVEARFDGGATRSGRSAAVRVDTSAPQLGAVSLTPKEELACGNSAESRTWLVRLPVTEPHSPLASVRWEMAGREVLALEAEELGTEAGEREIEFPVSTTSEGTQTLQVTVSNRAGREATVAVELPAAEACSPTPTASPSPTATLPPIATATPTLTSRTPGRTVPPTWTPAVPTETPAQPAGTATPVPRYRTRAGCTVVPTSSGRARIPLGGLFLLLGGIHTRRRRGARH